ncbi:nitrate ABC transporter substrate-binding protein [Rhizobium sp. ACO-34A]|nr:ABC transporter substrate-binding protein [Rhizobium sp. ACO-34A]ATN32299.1 nitrate ABC transporter substrate-binding protein [Rhizobium sp. ACO-34A]
MQSTSFSRRQFLAISAATAASGALPGIGHAQSQTIRIGVGSDPVFSSFYLASHEGLFEAENVNVALQLYTDGGEAMNALVAGQVDVSAASEPTTLIRLSRAELRPLSIVYQSGKYIKLVLGKDIAEPKDIKRFGIVAGSVSQYCAGLTVEKLGLDTGSIEYVQSGPPELPALLARGDIDAFFAWEPWPANAVQQGGKIALTSGDVGYRDTMWISATAAMLAADPEGLRAMLRALSKAATIVREDHARAAAAIRAVTRIPQETSLKALADMTPIVRDFTADDFASYDNIVGFLVDQKVMSSPIAYRDMLQAGFYKG